MASSLSLILSLNIITIATLVILIEAALRLLVRRPKLHADAFIGGHCAY